MKCRLVDIVSWNHIPPVAEIAVQSVGDVESALVGSLNHHGRFVVDIVRRPVEAGIGGAWWPISVGVAVLGEVGPHLVQGLAHGKFLRSVGTEFRSGLSAGLPPTRQVCTVACPVDAEGEVVAPGDISPRQQVVVAPVEDRALAVLGCVEEQSLSSVTGGAEEEAVGYHVGGKDAIVGQGRVRSRVDALGIFVGLLVAEKHVGDDFQHVGAQWLRKNLVDEDHGLIRGGANHVRDIDDPTSLESFQRAHRQVVGTDSRGPNHNDLQDLFNAGFEIHFGLDLGIQELVHRLLAHANLHLRPVRTGGVDSAVKMLTKNASQGQGTVNVTVGFTERVGVHNRGLELALILRASKVGGDGHGASRLTHESNTVGIASKGLNVIVYPVTSHHLVHKTEVSTDGAAAAKVEEAPVTETVVDYNNNLASVLDVGRTIVEQSTTDFDTTSVTIVEVSVQ